MSEEALADFAEFFLETCVDQVKFMEAVFFRGELPHGEIAGLLDASGRNARRVTSALLERGVLASKSTRAPFLLAFPAALASRWMPGLFPEKAE